MKTKNYKTKEDVLNEKIIEQKIRIYKTKEEVLKEKIVEQKIRIYKTKEDVLKEKLKEHNIKASFSLTKEVIFDAMQEYANQEVLKFKNNDQI